jgi:hypothetical protein
MRLDLMARGVQLAEFGGNGAGGASDAAPGTAALGDAQGVVALLREGCNLLLLVGEVALCSGQLCLAGFAIQGEIVKRFQVRTRD